MNIKQRTYKQDRVHSKRSYNANAEKKQQKQKNIKDSRTLKYTDWSI